MARVLRVTLAIVLALTLAPPLQAQMGQRPRPFPGGGPTFPSGGPMQGGPLTPREGMMRVESRVPYIDTHAHLDGQSPLGPADWSGAAAAALETMDALKIRKSLVMPPPFPANHANRYDHEALLGVARKSPERFAVLGGGGSLNGMIQEAASAGGVSPALERDFEQRAEKIVRDGAVGFGEMTAEHLSFNPHHPYESAPPDHPLFLRLADIAARLNVPIDLHMEALTRDLTTPPRFAVPPNSPVLRENIRGLERLLAHNPKARIVWVHAGWDNTGDWTVDLSRRLLDAHPNLFMSIKIDQLSLEQSRPLAGGTIRPEWLELIRAFPDRFVVGSDQFYSSPRMPMPMRRPRSSDALPVFLNQLPADLAQKVAVDNAVRLYNLVPAR